MEARRFPEPEVVGSIPTAGDLLSALDTWALSSVEERPFRIREVEGSNPSVSIFSPTAVVPKRLRGWTRNPLGSARAGSSPADCDFGKVTRVGFEPTPPKRLRP